MIHIYTGNGKGKTTSSFGLAMRASGQGLKVVIFQFLKPRKLVCGEEISAKKIKSIKVVKYEQEHPMFMEKKEVFSIRGVYPERSRETRLKNIVRARPKAESRTKEKIKKSIGKAMADAKRAIFGGKYDMIILDEVINVIDQGFSGKKEFLDLVKNAPGDIELVLTGRGDISELEKFADYVTIMVDKKHPLRQQVNARKGIEY
ncbi:MAG: cob(I)yrinic acid a,c-diamide adenosyltransferase [Candidatus Omnitrophota bacterium]|nr:cob(I)yrinic acid a,c-diamide adenosyltransferase [Candidatus Omnitrophota bacterium]